MWCMFIKTLSQEQLPKDFSFNFLWVYLYKQGREALLDDVEVSLSMISTPS